MAAAVKDELKAARKQLEKKNTFVSGLERIHSVVAAADLEGCEKEALDAVQRCKTVLISRYNSGELWDKCLALMAVAEERVAGGEAVGEWVVQLERSRPGVEVEPHAAPEAKASDVPRAQPPGPRTGLDEEMRSLLPPDIAALLEHVPTEELTRFFNQVHHNPASLKTLRELTLLTIPHNADPGEYQCVICLDDIPPRTKAKRMACKHLFHEGCLLTWLEKHNTCPVCRYIHHTDMPSTKPEPAAPTPDSYMS